MERNQIPRAGNNNITAKQPELVLVSRAINHGQSVKDSHNHKSNDDDNNQPLRRHAGGPAALLSAMRFYREPTTCSALISNPSYLPSSAITNPDITPHQSNNYQYEPNAIVPYNVHAYDAMAAITPQQHNAPYMPKAFPPNFLPIANLNVNMPSYTGTATSQMGRSLEILNAEQYDDGTGIITAATQNVGMGQRKSPYKSPTQVFGITHGVEPHTRSTVQSRKKSDGQRSPSGDQSQGERRRKKMKVSDEEEADEDEASRKVRGRPRLDTKDETAADVWLFPILLSSVSSG
jgi:hypothetical protein